jgi:hypothetical protein
MDDLQFPGINLNGADATDLARQYYEAAKAVEHAADLQARIVHGRDYQTLSPEAYQKALDQMVERQKKLIEVYNDLRMLADYCIGEAR